MTTQERPRRRPTGRTAAVGLLTLAVVAAPAAVALAGPTGSPPTVLTPIGGGYEESTLAGFSRVAAERVTGSTVDLVVVPAAYGDSAKERAKNLALAQSRTDQVDAACDAAVPAGLTCTATLAVLLNRADAMDPANSAALRASSTDGIYLLGGDLEIAMDVLAGSPAETAITQAVEQRGVLLGGTSAGAAVESRNMINGYTSLSDTPALGLRRNSTLMWWDDGDDDTTRGLVVGSSRAIFDQHFYQRGRFGRTLSTMATAQERYGVDAAPVGVGVDYATGIRDTGDATLSGLFGDSSAAIVDYRTLGATHSWVGSPSTLSARRVLTHLMTDGSSYDLVTRAFTRGGTVAATPTAGAWSPPSSPSTVGGTVFLGGGVLGTEVVSDVVTAAQAVSSAKTARVVVLAAGPGSSALANSYSQAVKKAGWAGSVTTVVYGSKGWSTKTLAGATAVVLAGDDPAALASTMAQPAFRDAVTTAVRTTPVVLADGAMSTVLGSRWSASPNAPENDLDALEASGVAAFRAGDAAWQSGLALVDATVVPHLTDDYRWGRLYGAVTEAPQRLAIGVAPGAAVVLAPSGPSVSGTSVVVTDGREGSYWTGSNGAMGASGVVLDVFGDGERLAR